MKRGIMGAALSALVMVGLMSWAAQAQTVVTWDGGTADFGAANWNGGMTAAAVFGDNRMSNGAFDVTIGNGTVTYAAGSGGTGNAIRPRSNVGPTTITIEGGATFHQTTIPAGDADGMWTTYDADLNLDNGTFKRDWEAGGNAQAGGILMFGSWRSIQNQAININLTNGGKIENDGQIWFGADEEHALGLQVSMIIDNGSLDLTGGAYPTSNNTNIVSAEMAFWYGTDQGKGAGQTFSGLPKGEKYEVNFRDAGSITVDSSGIWVYDQDSVGSWTSGQKTYEDLWTRGILKSHGMSGLDGTLFSNFFTTTGTSGMNDYKVTAKTGTTVTWDGGNDIWQAAKWNGGQTSAVAMGRNNGTEDAHNVVIGGGAQVMYTSDSLDLYNSDFRLKSQNGPTSVTIKEGASLTLHSQNTDADGKWTEWDGDLTLDNGTLNRTYAASSTGNTVSGGALIFGSWRSRQGQEIAVDIINGGQLNNDGQVWFGAGEDQAIGLEVTFTIDDGALDLTGGDDFPMIGIDPNGDADMSFFYAYDVPTSAPKGEKYAINFTGPGSITVDHSGIDVYTQDETTAFTVDDKTYEELWGLGILQANGKSGMTGATFGDFFSVIGSAGMDNYILTSLIGAGLAGDYNGNGVVDAADYVVWRNGGSPDSTVAGYNLWRANFGNTAGSGASLGASAAAVPEPSSIALVVFGVMGLFVSARRRQQ